MPAGSHVPVTSLYVHVPFCAHKCEYCAFFSEAPTGEVMNRYVAALVREMDLVAGGLRPRTVFFGGGTPSLLNLDQWRKIFGAMERLNLLGAGEWTIECNPATVSLEKARLWREHGVNRISMGVQSLNEDLLDRLGRIHSRQMVFKSFDVLRQAGFDNLNIDLMFAIPGQTLEIWRETLDEAIALGSEHLSSYEVIYEDDTPLFQQLKAGEFEVDEELACAMYDELVERVTARGFVQYEVANFARPGSQAGGGAGCNFDPIPTDDACIPGFACRHNVNYWRGGSYHGLGPSAAGYVRGVRTKNIANTQVYSEHLERGTRPIDWREELPPLRRAGETAAFGLRMNSGWPFAPFVETTGFDLRNEWDSEMRSLIARGWGEMDAARFRLNRKGLRFADAAAEMFLK